MNNITLSEIAKRLRESRVVLLLSHTSPDGDTAGSAVGLAVMLEELGKEVICLCDSPLPEYISFIGAERFQTETDRIPDLILSLDVASPQQLGRLADRYADAVDIRIDHHAMGSDFGRFNYCQHDAAAVCQIIAGLAGLLGGLTPPAAAPLYVGLSTDTGGFRFSNTTPDALRTAAELLEAGAPSEEINDRLYESMNLDVLRSHSFFLEHMEAFDDGRILLIPIEEQHRIAAGLSLESLEGLSSLARRINGVHLGISLRQREPGVYRVSMRSDRTVNCAALCALFGGGGHLRAAGASIQADSFAKAKAILMDTVRESIVYDESGSVL